MSDSRGPFRRSRAARLLAHVMAAGALSGDDLVRHLGVSVEQLARYRDGHDRMPFDRRLRLALLVLAAAPGFAGEAYGLRGQLEAELAYRARAATTHDLPPVQTHRSSAPSVRRADAGDRD